MYTDKNLTIHPIKETDLSRLWELIYSEEQPEWKKWDAPYSPHQAMAYEEFLPDGKSLVNSDYLWVIKVEGKIRGTISYYWEHEPSQ